MAARTIISTLRHACTDYNDEKRYAGSLDIGLSGHGVREATAASGRLRSTKYDVVVTSTLRRTYETARIIVRESAPIVMSRLCVERNFGIMEGLTWSDVLKLEPPILMVRVGGDLHTVNPRGGEPFENVWDRAKRFRRLLLRRYEGGNILVVSHGVFLQMFHGVVRGLNCIESLAVYPANLELTRLVISGDRLLEERTVLLDDRRGNQW